MAITEKFTKFCSSSFGKRVLEREANYLFNELRDCKKILDVGCGIGTFEERMPDFDIIGIDIDKKHTSFF